MSLKISTLFFMVVTGYFPVFASQHIGKLVCDTCNVDSVTLIKGIYNSSGVNLLNSKRDTSAHDTVGLSRDSSHLGMLISVKRDTSAHDTVGLSRDSSHLGALIAARQAAYTNLTSIGSLTNGAGWLYNGGTGTFSYTTPTYSQVGADAAGAAAAITLAGLGGLALHATADSATAADRARIALGADTVFSMIEWSRLHGTKVADSTAKLPNTYTFGTGVYNYDSLQCHGVSISRAGNILATGRIQTNVGMDINPGISGGSDFGSGGSIWDETSPDFSLNIAGHGVKIYTGNNGARAMSVFISHNGTAYFSKGISDSGNIWTSGSVTASHFIGYVDSTAKVPNSYTLGTGVYNMDSVNIHGNVFQRNGNVGIGTVSPANGMLDVEGGSGTGIYAGSAGGTAGYFSGVGNGIESHATYGYGVYSQGGTYDFYGAGPKSYFVNAYISGYSSTLCGADVTAADSIECTGAIFDVIGTTTITKIGSAFSRAGQSGTISIIPKALFVTAKGSNIGIASIAVINKTLVMTYHATDKLWTPSY